MGYCIDCYYYTGLICLFIGTKKDRHDGCRHWEEDIEWWEDKYETE